MPQDLKLLLVEDSETDTELLVRHIQKAGYLPNYQRVDTESSMLKALQETPWDAILCDYHLPAFDALSALALSKEKKPLIPFIIVSGSVREEDAVLALKAGANDYILKNNLTRLIPALEREINEAKNRLEKITIESELKKKEQELRQAQKLDAVGQLAGGIAHDFNNILSIILMHTETTLEFLNSNPKLKSSAGIIYKSIEQIKKSSERASNLTRQLLAFSRKQVIKPIVLNLNEVISEMDKMLARVVEENIDFKIQLDKNLRNIKVDPGHLEQILMNLVVNGRDAMQGGGTLTIKTENSFISEEIANRYQSVPGHAVLLTVTDTGCGMSDEVQKHIFDPFFTTKEVGKGTGLGLSIVYGIVKQNKGLIFVESKPEQGTAFKVYFPVTHEGVSSPKSVAPMSSNRPRGGETILVVEDEHDLRTIVCDALSSHGYKILQAENGIKGLELVKGYKDPIDLIVTDVVMPQMGGAEFAKAVQELKGPLSFLFLSGYTEDILIQQGINSGSIHFLEKPYTPKLLLEKLEVLLRNPKPEK